jgi:hypothetical protein
MAAADQYLQAASPVRADGCLLFSERTRLRYSWYDRTSYMKGLKGLYERVLEETSVGLRILTAVNLDSQMLDQCSVVVLMESSGLNATAAEKIRNYTLHGGTLIVSGDAMRFGVQGERLPDFVRSTDLIGVHYQETRCFSEPTQWVISDSGNTQPPFAAISLSSSPSCVNVVSTELTTKTIKTVTVLNASGGKLQIPLVTRRSVGRGTVFYVAAKQDNSIGADSNLTTGLLHGIMLGDNTMPPALRLPFFVKGPADPGERVVVTKQSKRWVIYFVGNASTTVTLTKAAFPDATRVGAVRSWHDNG